MNTQIIIDTHHATLTGTIAFPEVVRRLLEAGVEFYHVDYLGLRQTYTGLGDGAVSTTISIEDLPPVAADFDAAAVRADILDSQRNGQHYRDFTRRAMEAGVAGYFAFLRGQRVIYYGRQGDQHTEWFPGARPE